MLKTAKVVGLNSDTEAALSWATMEGGLGLFLIVSCSFDDAFARTRQVLAEAQETFYGEAEGSNSGGSVSERLNKIFLQVKESLTGVDNLQILAAATQKEQSQTVLYLLCLGEEVTALLIREEVRTDLGGMSNGQLVSGLLTPGDRVILATKSLIELLDGNAVNLAKFPVENFEDEVAVRLPEAEPYPVAAVVLEEESEVSSEEVKISEALPGSGEALGDSLNFGSMLRRIAGLGFKLLPRSKRGILYLGLGLILAFGAGLVFIQKQKGETQVQASFEAHFKAAVSEYEKAQNLKDQDSQAALSSWSAAKASVIEALKIKPQDQQALSLQKSLEEGEGDILKIYQVENFPLWLDLDLVKKGLSSERLSASLGNLLVLDKSQKILVEVGISNKSQQSLAGQEKLGEAKLASLNGEMAWVYSDRGMVRVDTKSKQAAVVVEKDDEWGNIAEIFGFAGNIYLLDESGGQIWKYVPVAAGYSEKRAYFKEGIRVDLVGTKRLQIDSSVWILKDNGEILKFTQGSADFFSVGGLDKPVKEPKSFFVSDQTDNLYLLDSGNNRLLVLDKKGVYKTQYRSEKFSAFSDLVVDEEGKKVYLLEGSKIYLMELK